MSLKERIDNLSPRDRKLYLISVVLIIVSTIILVGVFLSSTKAGTVQNRIDVVKHGYFNGHKSNTIGFLIDNWKNCDSTAWGYFSNANKEEVVEVYCDDTTVFLPLINYMKSQSDGEFTDIASHKIVIQWKLTGKNAFKVDFVGSVMDWKDGRESIDPYLNNPSGKVMLARIFSNERMISDKDMRENLDQIAVTVKKRYELGKDKTE